MVLLGVRITTAKFVSGSVVKHILAMTMTSSIGLFAILLVDLVDLYFIAQLGRPELTASIGFASVLLFSTTAIAIGCQVGAGVIIARAEGQSDRVHVKRYYSHAMLFSGLVSVAFGMLIFYWRSEILQLLGATEPVLAHANTYAGIVLMSTPLLVVGMSTASALRSLADAKRSMYAILAGALINVVLDPLLIFGFDLGLRGAAWATFISRIGMVIVGVYGMSAYHKVGIRFVPSHVLRDFGVWLMIAGPAILTSLSTPLGAMIIMKSMAQFGVDAIAGAAVINRVIPLAFAGLFSLSGAVGPIIGQNMGALRFDRVQACLRLSLGLAFIYVLVVWLLFVLLADVLVSGFAIVGIGRDLVVFYSYFLVGSYLFNAMLFVANSALNNMGYALYATFFNFSRSVFGILPAVVVLAPIYGAKGVLLAESLGQMVWGICAFSVASLDRKSVV